LQALVQPVEGALMKEQPGTRFAMLAGALLPVEADELFFAGEGIIR
jgi:hypothetical protein